jgi:hypothetical protein
VSARWPVQQRLRGYSWGEDTRDSRGEDAVGVPALLRQHSEWPPARHVSVMLAEVADTVACQHLLQCEGAAINANVAEPGLAVVETKVAVTETARPRSGARR